MLSGFVAPPGASCGDYTTIGNREVTENRRRAYWSEFQHQRTELPGEIVSVIDQINMLNEASDVGFRRRNLPALLARYFLDTRGVPKHRDAD